MKKFLLISLAKLILLPNLCAAQSITDSRVYIEQIGSHNAIDVIQIGSKNNHINYYGNGSNNDISITQRAQNDTQTNSLNLSVVGDFNTVDIKQRTSNETNPLSKNIVANVSGNNNNLFVDQKNSGSHHAEITLSGGNKNVDITQQGSGSHIANITLTGGAASVTATQSGSVQQNYSLVQNCVSGSCPSITINQGQ